MHSNSLLWPRSLFRFALPLHRHAAVGVSPGLALDGWYRLVDFVDFDSGTPYAERSFTDVRMTWNGSGLAFHVLVHGKHQLPWCRESRLEDSDGFQVWIDTRATHYIHRAIKFCHRFIFMPNGGGQKAEQPVADQHLINRARENARPVRPGELQAVSKVAKTPYELFAYLPAQALGDYDPQQHPRLGFTYAIFDSAPQSTQSQALENEPPLADNALPILPH